MHEAHPYSRSAHIRPAFLEDIPRSSDTETGDTAKCLARALPHLWLFKPPRLPPSSVPHLLPQPRQLSHFIHTPHTPAITPSSCPPRTNSHKPHPRCPLTRKHSRPPLRARVSCSTSRRATPSGSALCLTVPPSKTSSLSPVVLCSHIGGLNQPRSSERRKAERTDSSSSVSTVDSTTTSTSSSSSTKSH